VSYVRETGQYYVADQEVLGIVWEWVEVGMPGRRGAAEEMKGIGRGGNGDGGDGNGDECRECEKEGRGECERGV